MPLATLCLGQLVNAGSGAVGLAMLMTGNESGVMRSIAAGSAIALNFLLIPLFGTRAAAVGTAVRVAIGNGLVRALWRAAGIWDAVFGRPRRFPMRR